MLSDEASKLHKSLDLAIYLDYLRQLFSQSTSDSDSSDSEPQVIEHEEINPPSQGNPTPTSTPPNPTNDTSCSSRSSSKSNFNFTPSSTNSNEDDESSHSVRSRKSSRSSGTGNSASTSENSTDEEDDCSDLDLAPISDLELSNLFLDHKLWKKSPELAQDFLAMPQDNKDSGQCSNSHTLQGDHNRKQSLQNFKSKHSSSNLMKEDLKLDIDAKIEDCLDLAEGILENDSVNQPSSSRHILMTKNEGGEIDEDDQDDNDSLSDYMNMTANSALVLDPYFKYESDCLTPNSVTPVPRVMNKIHAHEIRKQHKYLSRTSGGSHSSHCHSSSKHKKLSEQKKAKTIESMNIKRRRLYILLCKKEIGKTQRARVNNHKEMLVTQRRLALACNRHFKKKAIQSQKAMKESIWRAKRHSREMQAYWKQADRVERELRKRREKEAEELQKFDIDLMETKTQQRKMNFLLTQVELCAHFMAKKLGGTSSIITREEKDILNQLEEPNTSSDSIDYDIEEIKNKVIRNVENACKIQQSQVQLYDLNCTNSKNEISFDSEVTQPSMFKGDLKHYQLKGLNWLVSLYNQGINGILADDMGLGKTVQSIALLSHITERYGLWSPFLVIAPTSTLQNWQQEFTRFLPDFKVVPYWGNVQERKICRQFWQFNNLYAQRASSFHVVVTSYQIVVADVKYFNRIKWQFLILDEAQAIKSTTSVRWKLLLGFNCRNRLLLTGTPIQNTIGELCALLYFIMPSLFDSQDEFNELFSKDFESAVENKYVLDAGYISRLHMILKPFMLRRVKKDIENELVDKIEILLKCKLTDAQRRRYIALRKKVRVEDLIKSAGSINSQLVQHATTNLMNLVTQFRKVCNHLSLFERHQVYSPFYMPRVVDIYPVPLLLDGLHELCVKRKLDMLQTDFSIYNPSHINNSLLMRDLNCTIDGKTVDSEWSFLRFIGLSISEFYKIVYGGLLARWNCVLDVNQKFDLICWQRHWNKANSEVSQFMGNSDFLLSINFPLSRTNKNGSEIMQDFVFLTWSGSIYALLEEKISSIPESIEHRNLRYRKSLLQDVQEPCLFENFIHKQKDPEIRQVCPSEMPRFLSNFCPKVRSGRRQIDFCTLQDHSCFSDRVFTNTLAGCFSHPDDFGNLSTFSPTNGWSQLIIPDKDKLITDSGKVRVLDNLMEKLEANGHRVLLYSQMTRMIDILEEYIRHRKWKYLRLDGSSKISDRRNMVAEFQSRSEIFVFLLSTRAGSLGINLTAADTVIFFDSDWNPIVDQQAIDRAHRLGQTKQVTVYRLICEGTIEERILQIAKEKKELQKSVSGGSSTEDTLKPAEVVSILLDDGPLEKIYLQDQLNYRSAVESITDESIDNSKQLSGIKRKSLPVIEKVPLYRKKDTESKKSKLHDSIAATLVGGPEYKSLVVSEGSDVELDLQQEIFADEEACDEVADDVFSSNEDECVEGSDPDGVGVDDYDTVDGGPCLKAHSNTESVSDIEDEFGFISRQKLGRGSGKRGRPPLRVRTVTREIDADSPFRRGPGRPRIKPIGPANQGIRGRGPGRPPLSKKAENSSSSLTLTTSQKVFGFYSSLDLDPA